MDREPDLDEMRSGASVRPRSGGPRFTPRTYSLDEPVPGPAVRPSRPGFSPSPGPSRSDHQFVTGYQAGSVPLAAGKAAGWPGGGWPGGPGGPAGPGGDGTGPGRSRKRKILKWASLITTVVLVAASLTAYVAYRDVVDGIKQENVSHLLGPKRPVQYTSAQNILVIGSDSRVGTHGQFGSAQAIQGARSDTMMLLHILPGHKGAVVISFPRDSLVPIVGCQPDGTGTKGQTAQPGGNEMLNATYAAGGAACLWRTLESTTGIFINHFVEINFGGFQSVVNDLGGVNVCLPEAIDDPASHLDLSAGQHHVNGVQALAFVRERHIGEGSDLQRIQRQQYFMAALVQQIESQNVLSNVTQVFSIARDVAKTLTTDSGLSVNDMRGIATSMKGLSTKGVQFTQVPVVQDPADANRVLWQQPQAASLFSEIAHDQTVKPKPGATPRASVSATPAAPAVSPSSVQVNVLNGAGIAGLAAKAATALTQKAFHVIGTGDAAAPSSATIVQYSSADEAGAARALAAMVPNAEVQPVSAASGVASDAVDLILGSDYTGIHPAASPSPGRSATGSGSSAGIGNVTKTYGGI
ncbi:MAG TPA: LCP family protein, partial [Streptosporangiaceae bacterium]